MFCYLKCLFKYLLKNLLMIFIELLMLFQNRLARLCLNRSCMTSLSIKLTVPIFIPLLEMLVNEMSRIDYLIFSSFFN